MALNPRGAPPERRFRYRAADTSGRVVTGTLGGASDDAVRAELLTRSLVPLDVHEHRLGFEWPRGRVSRQDLAAVFRNVASLTNAGMPIERALAASEPLVGKVLAGVLADVRRRIREGSGVAEALGAHDRMFPESLLGTVGAGERGSSLPEALDRAALQLDQESQLRAEIRSALAYPALILFVGLLSILVMSLVVIPRFAELLADLGAELPSSTRALLFAGTALQRYGLPISITGVGGLVALRSLGRRDGFRRFSDRAALRLPVAGSIIHGFASARVCRALGAMLGAGMPLIPALAASRDAAGNLEVGQRIADASREVSEGSPLAHALSNQGAFVPLALQMVAIGETTGELAGMVTRAGDLAADRAERRLRAATSLLEPLLVMALGLGVALVAAALLQAVYAVRPGV